LASAEKPSFWERPEAALAASALTAETVPVHIAIIMDGNGRWAAARRLPRIAGHKAGVKAVRETIRAAAETGVRYLTLFSFSSENWRRPADEVSGLMKLFAEVLHREVVNLQELDVRVRLIGRRQGIPASTLQTFIEAEEATAKNGSLDLLIALNYGGRAEIVDAAKALVLKTQQRVLNIDEIDEGAFAAELYAPDVPDPDLLIRTSGELRVSNFLLWQVAYSELVVSPLLWPDFDRYAFLDAIISFNTRVRRFGAT